MNNDDIADTNKLNIRGDNQTPLNDIFVIDGDDENVVKERLNVASTSKPHKNIRTFT